MPENAKCKCYLCTRKYLSEDWSISEVLQYRDYFCRQK